MGVLAHEANVVMNANVRRNGAKMIQSLCEACAHMKKVDSAKGSRFLLCQLSQTDRRFPKYPPQPVDTCAGYTRLLEDKSCSE